MIVHAYIKPNWRITDFSLKKINLISIKLIIGKNKNFNKKIILGSFKESINGIPKASKLFFPKFITVKIMAVKNFL
jgi:hypothetical protein